MISETMLASEDSHDAATMSSRRHGRISWIGAAFALLAGAFVLDCLSGDEVSSSLFYVIGIGAAAWFVGQSAGILFAFFSAAAWGTAVHFVGPAFSTTNLFYWNLGVELIIYLTTGVALARIHTGLLQEHRLVEMLNLATSTLDQETRAVGDLQREMLPLNLPQVDGYEWQVHYATSTHAGGDYYDFFFLPDGRIGILLADASGHGAQAAILMAMVRVLLRTTRESLSRPDQVLFRLGHQIAETVPVGRFATACYVVLDPSTGRIEYSLAGHPPPFFLRGADGTVEEFPQRGGPPLGVFPDILFETGSTAIGPGDTLVLYTDGLTDAASATEELFGERRLRQAFEGSPIALDHLQTRVLTHLAEHTGVVALEDDLTLLMLRRTPRGW